MKLTLILDAGPAGICARIVEEWDWIAGEMRMEPMVRRFDTDDEALAWGRLVARRRGVGRLYLTDNRKTGQR
jgi:hypothetical protein